MHRVSKNERTMHMNSFNDFKTYISTKIKEIDAEYKSIYNTYEPTKEEQRLITFLDDIWGIRFEDETKNSSMKNACVQVAFMDKDNSNHFIEKNYRIGKLHPKKKQTTPLYFLISRLANCKEYHFYFCPNIFLHSSGNLFNIDKNISFSNCYYVDIDRPQNPKNPKPIYNWTEQEILDFLFQEYPMLLQTPPSYIVMSGFGLHLYFSLEKSEYLLQTQYINKQRDRHKQLTKDYVKLLEADKSATNLNRLLRVPFSFNMKYSIKTRFFVYEDSVKKYSYDILHSNTKKYLLPVDPVELKDVFQKTSNTNEEKIPKKNNRKNLNTTVEYRSQIAVKARDTLFNARKKDLEKWFYLHIDSMSGYRHKFFLIYSLVLRELRSTDEYISKQCKYLNSKISIPLTANELEKTITSKTKYKFKNETIAEWLDFTHYEILEFECNYDEETQREHHLEYSRQYHKKEKDQRKERKENKEFQIFSIIKSNPNATVRELAELLSCSPATAHRWLQKYKRSH